MRKLPKWLEKAIIDIRTIAQDTQNSYTDTSLLCLPIHRWGCLITSPYGYRWLGGKRQLHRGIDFVSKDHKHMGVRSITSGIVIKAFKKYSPSERWDLNKPSSAGKFVIIKHKIHGKEYYARYLHLSEIHVSEGGRVRAGKQIGVYSDYGYSTGPHLHFDLWTDKWKRINPTSILRRGLAANGVSWKELLA